MRKRQGQQGEGEKHEEVRSTVGVSGLCKVEKDCGKEQRLWEVQKDWCRERRIVGI